MEEEEEKKGIAWHGSSADSMRIAITPIVTFPITYKSCRTKAIEQKKVRDGRRKWPYITPEMEVGGAVCGRALPERETIICHSFFFLLFYSVEEGIFVGSWSNENCVNAVRIRVQAVFNERRKAECLHLFKDKLDRALWTTSRVCNRSICINVVAETISRRGTSWFARLLAKRE